jgi:hypothetical protein
VEANVSVDSEKLYQQTDLLYGTEEQIKYQSTKLKNISSKQALSVSLNLQQLVPVFLQLCLLQISLASLQKVLYN